MCIGALKGRLPAWWSSSANPQSRSLGARDSDAGLMLVEERAALLAQLVVRRMRLAFLIVWVVYYKQIRKSEQRPPLHLRAADLVPQPRTPVCHMAIAWSKLR